MEYIKITPEYGLCGVAKLSKYDGIESYPTHALIKNEIESVWYNEDSIKIYRPKQSGVVSISARGTLPKVEIITRKEYYAVINGLKNRKIVKPVEKPKEPYVIDEQNSTNTHIVYTPKPGFEVGFTKVYRLEWFESMGAAYPVEQMMPFTNKPYSITVDTKKYNGYKFSPEESTIEKSVYNIVWPRKRDFEKDEMVWR